MTPSTPLSDAVDPLVEEGIGSVGFQMSTALKCAPEALRFGGGEREARLASLIKRKLAEFRAPQANVLERDVPLLLASAIADHWASDGELVDRLADELRACGIARFSHAVQAATVAVVAAIKGEA